MALLMTYPLVLHLTTAIPGDGFDGWQNYWNLWWVKTSLLDLQQSPYFTHYLYYPTGCSLLFQTLNIFNSFLTLPVQLTLGLTPSYNFVVLFSFVMGGYGAYLLALCVLRAGRGGRVQAAAFLAGVVFSFSPFHFAHLLGHMQVISLEWLPFYALCLVKALSSDRLRLLPHVVLPVVFLVLTALCDWYFLLYLLIFTVVYLAYRLIVGRRSWLPVVKTALILAPTVLLLFPLLVPMVVEAARDSSYLLSPFETTVSLSADLLAFVTPNGFHPLWGDAASHLASSFTGSTSERMVFLGYIPLALAGYAAWSRRRESVFWLACGLLFFVLALGPYLHAGGRQLAIPLPYLGLYRLLPFFSIARSVSRFAVMVMLSLGCLAALGLQRALSFSPGRRARVVAALTVALVCFEFLPVPYPLSRVEIPSFYETLAGDGSEYAVLELPMNWDRPTHLLYQTVHHKPLVAGYVTRPNPLSLVERVPVLQHFRLLRPDIIAQDLREIAPAVWEYIGVKYVILHDYMLPPGREREANLALVEEVFGEQMPVYEDGLITVYLVGGQTVDLPLLVLGEGWGERQTVDGGPARGLGAGATLAIVAPEDSEARLVFTAFSEAGTRTLSLLLGERAVGSYQIEPANARFESGPLSLSRGVNTLRLVDGSSGEPGIVFTSVSVEGED